MNKLCVLAGVTSQETVFDSEQENLINFVSKRVAVLFRKMSQILLPDSVGILKLQYHRDKFGLRKASGGG